MRHEETHYGGNWLDKLLNSFPLLLDDTWILPLAEVGWGGNLVTGDRPAWGNVWINFWRACYMVSMYVNGIFYLRLLAPFGVFFMIRWSGSRTSRAFLQAGIGWKLNGRFAITFRIQSDESAAAGYWGPNSGQAGGWLQGPH